MKPDGRAHAEQANLVAQIIARYAVLEGGKVLRCGPRPGEDVEENWRWSGNDGKAVIREEQAAKDCARQLTVAKGIPVHHYRCPRSKSGHFHVADGRVGVALGHRKRRAQ